MKVENRSWTHNIVEVDVTDRRKHFIISYFPILDPLTNTCNNRGYGDQYWQLLTTGQWPVNHNNYWNIFFKHYTSFAAFPNYLNLNIAFVFKVTQIEAKYQSSMSKWWKYGFLQQQKSTWSATWHFPYTWWKCLLADRYGLPIRHYWQTVHKICTGTRALL